MVRPTRPILSSKDKVAVPMSARALAARAQASQAELTDTRDNDRPTGFEPPAEWQNTSD